MVRYRYVSGVRALPLPNVMTRCICGGGVGVGDRGLFRAIQRLGVSKLVTRKPIELLENVDTPRYTHTQVC
jgi:hypothetical protein